MIPPFFTLLSGKGIGGVVIEGEGGTSTEVGERKEVGKLRGGGGGQLGSLNFLLGILQIYTRLIERMTD